MTRETKVGLVVSCSFLCLVGVVLFTKLKERDGTEEEAQVSQAQPLPAEQGRSGPVQVEEMPALQTPGAPSIVQVQAQTEPGGGAGLPSSAAGGGGTPPAAAVPAPVPGTTESKDASLIPLPVPPDLKALPPVPPRTADTPGNKENPTPAKNAPGGPGAPDGNVSKVDEQGKPTLPEPPLAKVPVAAVPPQTPAAEPPAGPSSAEPPPLPPPPAGPSATPKPLDTPTSAPKSVEPPPPSPAPLTSLPPLEPGRKQPAGNGTPTAPAAPAAWPPTPNPEAGRGTAQTGVNLGQPTPPLPPAAASPSGGSPPGGALLRMPSPPPAADAASERPIQLRAPTAPVPPLNQIAQGPVTPLPTGSGSAAAAPAPRGTPAMLGSPPIPVARPLESARTANEIGARIESYDEETYRCKANDTFRSISEMFYLTPKYERALQQFNRDHPLATEAVRQGTATLPAGLAIFIPPPRILEKQYAAFLLERTAPPPAAPAPTPAAPIRMETPQPLRPATPTPRPPETPAATPAPSVGNPQYRVRQNGEMFWQIAQRTLSNPERWTDIYQLNRSLDPQQPVPGGSVLRLPIGARVPPENLP